MRLPTLIAALTVPMLLAGCGDEAPRPELSVENAWIRMPAVAGRPGAAYFTIRNGGEATTIEAVASPQIEGIELHDNVVRDGVTRMGPLTDRGVPAGGTLVFEPGGKHAMLMKLAPQIRPGGQVPLHFRFAGGKEVKAVAHVVAAGGEAPDHAGH